MKTIELSLPTSLKELHLNERFESIKDRLEFPFSKIVIFFRASLKRISVYYSSLGKISFGSKVEKSNLISRRISKGKKLNIRTPNFKMPSKKTIKFGLYAFALIVLLGVARRVINGPVSSNQDVVGGPKAVMEINQEYSFPLVDENGDEISEFKYIIEAAELRDEILVQGKPARAVEGRTFLVFNIKIKNEHSQGVEIYATDYVRLAANGNYDEMLAPDIHSSPVLVQAISTKPTRLGFPIYETDRNIELHVGEIDGEKQIISIQF